MHTFIVKALKPGSRRSDRRTNSQLRPSTSRSARFVIVASIVVLPLIMLPLFETNAVRSNGPSPASTQATRSSVPAPSGRKVVLRSDKSGKASIASDKADYAPGDIVMMTGNGWKPGEAISLRIHRTDRSPDVVLKAKSDATGGFTNKELVIKRSDIGVSFVVTALGLTSRRTAEIRFTDANVTVSTQYGGSANNNPNGLQTFTLTKQVFTGSTNCGTGGGTSTTVPDVGNPSPHVFALNPGDSVTLNAPQASNQNGSFQGWVSPDGGPFTQVGGSSNTICVPGDAAAHTYVAVYNPGLIVLGDTCMAGKTLFNLGEIVCVKVFAQNAPSFGQMMIQFQDPSGATRNDPSMFVINSDQQTFTFTLPSTNTTGSTDNRGTWLARIVNSTNALSNNALFRVRNPAAGQEAADLSVSKSAFSGLAPPNGTIQYEIRVGNEGPDPAQNVMLTDAVPANTTFFSYQQLSGPAFNCNTPAVGGTGTISCTGATLPVLALGSGLSDPVNTAVFRMVLKVNSGVPDGTLITNTASAATKTFDTRPNNNMSSANINVVATACSLTCSADITTGADTLCSGNPGKVVIFSNPASIGNCGAITCTPPSGSCFPVGTTTVSCSGNAVVCTFRVIVSPCALTCPANITKSNDPAQCGAVTNYTTPSGVGCGTVTCNPPSGSFFPIGTTTVTCTPTTGSPCTFTVTIQDTQPPTITCPANITAATSQNVCPTAVCAVVNFTTPTPTDNCPGANTVCTPPSGTCFPIGTTTVTCTITDASGNSASCSFTVTVFDVCLQDDSNPANVLLFNSLTGSYKFCCNGMTFSGTGTVLMKGCTISLNHFGTDRRVTAMIDKTQFKGNASLQAPPATLKCTIMDRDTRNNACACP